MKTQYKGSEIVILRDPINARDGDEWYALIDNSRFTETWEGEAEQYTLWPSAERALEHAKAWVDYQRGECNCPDCRTE